MRKALCLALFIISSLILFSIPVLAQSTNPWTISSSGTEKNEFSNLEQVYIKSNVLCEPATEVDLYIVEDKDPWLGDESLEDVKGSSQNINLTTSKIPLTKIWENPKAGSYDVVIDCNKNGVYDLYTDKVDSFSGVGFIVTAVAGTGKATIGAKDIGSHSWMYDSEEPILINEMLQLSLEVKGEDIKIENITIQASGTGNDEDIDKLEIYLDTNGNGVVDAGEEMIGDSQPAYSKDDGITILTSDAILSQDIIHNLLIVYQMKQNATQGEYSLIVKSLYGSGQDSGEMISFSGLPITSGTKKVLPKKTCFGSLVLELTPNPAVEGGIINARISGLDGCQNRTIILKTNPCGSVIQEKVGSCASGAEGCMISFNALVSETYHACVDKNEDSDMVDLGEYAFEELTVEGKPKTQPTVNVTGNLTANITKEEEEKEETEENTSETGGSVITGGVIGALTKGISGAGSLLLILEATLLLIFIVLVVIAFRLRVAKKPESKEEEK